MEQYIPKSALVAEIERLITPECGYSINKLIEFLNTLEVKEVDLEKEIDLEEDKYYGFDSLSRADIINIAKHFFELGLRASQPTTSVYGIEEALKENGIDPDSKEADMCREAIYKIYDRLQAQKGE